MAPRRSYAVADGDIDGFQPARHPLNKSVQLLSYLTQLDRNNLIGPCHYWSKQLSDEKADAVAYAILDVFHQWKERQADDDGNVIIRTGSGPIGDQEKLVPLSEAEPCWCAGPSVQSDIDLAFKLWLDGDAGFAAVVARYDLETVFSIVGLWSMRTAPLGSLVRLNSFLVASLQRHLHVHNDVLKVVVRSHKTRLLEAKARTRSAQEKRVAKQKMEAEETRDQYWRAAFEYASHHPAFDQDQIISYLLTLELPPRARTTIKRLIARAMEDGRKAHKARSSLYVPAQANKR